EIVIPKEDHGGGRDQAADDRSHSQAWVQHGRGKNQPVLKRLEAGSRPEIRKGSRPTSDGRRSNRGVAPPEPRCPTVQKPWGLHCLNSFLSKRSTGGLPDRRRTPPIPRP